MFFKMKQSSGVILDHLLYNFEIWYLLTEYYGNGDGNGIQIWASA